MFLVKKLASTIFPNIFSKLHPKTTWFSDLRKSFLCVGEMVQKVFFVHISKQNTQNLQYHASASKDKNEREISWFVFVMQDYYNKTMP